MRESENASGAGLERLPVRDASPERIRRIRAACLSELARGRSRADSRREAAQQWRGRLEMAVAAGLAALYLASAVERAFEIFG